MNIDHVRRRWEKNADLDPMWSILADPRRANRQWNPEEFFATGRTAVAQALRDVGLSWEEIGGETALDFGCGMGRLTRVLAERFAFVHGVDVSETMIALARAHNPHSDRIFFHANRAENLAFLADASIDFALSLIVLQHVPPRLIAGYLAEICRVLRPRGIAVVQIPTRRKRDGAWPRAKEKLKPYVPPAMLDAIRWLRGYRGPVLEMFGLPEREVRRITAGSGAGVERAAPDGRAGDAWHSNIYLIRKLP